MQLSSAFSRRRFLASVGAAATAAWLAPRFAWAQDGGAKKGVVEMLREGAASAEITVESLRNNISVLLGSGGNIAVLHGPDGKLLVDAGLTGSRARLIEALKSISPDPVRHVVNTHWHFDHTDGNEWLHSEGADIIAHANLRKRMSEPTRVEAWDHTFPPAPTGALPTIVVDKNLTLHLNGQRIAIEYYEPCHTDTDLSVQFTDANILHTGDTYWNGHFPFIDYSTGGSINETIRATEDNLAKVDDDSIVVPGHGPVGNKQTLGEYRDMLVDVRDKVAALKKQGKSLDEARAAKPTATYDAKWGGFVINPDTFVQLVYSGV